MKLVRTLALVSLAAALSPWTGLAQGDDAGGRMERPRTGDRTQWGQRTGGDRGGDRGGDDRFGGRNPMAAMLMRGAMQPPVVVATDKFLFIVRGSTVFKLDVGTLEILAQKELPMPEFPGRPGDDGDRPERPPMEGAPPRPKR
jgi:hypothetical protein